MSIWAIIPAKSPDAAKARLAPALSAAERAALARRFFRGTVEAALACPALAGVIVVSASPELRALAVELGAHAWPDPPSPGTPRQWGGDALNAAIAFGCARAAALGATAALVLPADLPLLAPTVIAEFLDEAGDAAVALAPDRANVGTNALLLRPPRALAPAFGPASFDRHRAAARARGLSVAVVRRPALALDLDTPADLALLGCAGAHGAEVGHG
jgi:2-phospho-L-lactate/phosphoenolpyruvate guanylyltransferase